MTKDWVTPEDIAAVLWNGFCYQCNENFGTAGCCEGCLVVSAKTQVGWLHIQRQRTARERVKEAKENVMAG